MNEKFRIEFAHICEDVILAKNGNLSIINIFNRINADNFPAIHSKLTVVIGATGEEGKYEVSVQIKKTGEEQPVVMQSLPNKMDIPKFPAQGRLFINFSPFVIKSAGSYEITISVSGQTKTLFFEAKQSTV